MGKNKKRKKRASKQPDGHLKKPAVSGCAVVPSRHLHVSNSARHGVQLPLPYPHSPDLPIPDGEFLRNEDPYKNSFQVALDTSYEGFAVDLPSKSESDNSTNAKKRKHKDEQKVASPREVFPHKDIRKALSVMEDAGFFRTDVTQPFGLGTKCAKTYVTRCLLGERGTTYKYLGLRMFAHPWDVAGKNEKRGGEMSLKEAIATIRELNETLTERTKVHLNDLDEKRKERGAEATRGRAKFDITLINRMENTDDLKPEPSMGEGRCSVSWHADSSLEHYSTIAVYHTLFKKPNAPSQSGQDSTRWSVALRVARNSEGPHASRRGMDIDSSIVKETPPIAVSLPSGSAYYLLDDFNHHHQHAVIASGGTGEVRFSSTHRLLRESHNVNFIIERCRNVCSNFHKKGPKIWRSEQLLLTEIESEWLRQYYIQGLGHNELLWETWGDPMRLLLRHWSQLESRTKQTIDLLRAGAEGRCGVETSTSMDTSKVPSRAERKMREKRKKACATLEEILSRSGEQTDNKDANALETIYEPLAMMLEERAKMRELWSKRESDHVFRELGRDCAPIPLPVDFGVSPQEGKSSERGCSPMRGAAQDLRSIATSLRALGKSYMTQNPAHLPKLENASPENSVSLQAASKNQTQENVAKNAPESEHSMPLTWEGWNRFDFGLEMQSPWAEMLLEGRKTIETRLYDLPLALLGKRIDIIKSRRGTGGVSSLGNVVAVGKDSTVELAGWCTFSRVIKYVNQSDFEADENEHLVTKDSGYGWKEGKTQVVYGWVVGESGSYAKEKESIVFIRRMRSLFERQPAPVPGSSGKEGDELAMEEKAPAKKRRSSSKPKKKKRKKRF